MVLSQNEQKLRHSAAHLAAHALKELFPDVKLTLGPATEHGFFYDFLPTTNLKESDLPAIEKRMLEIANRSLELTHEMIDKQQARELYKDNPFKLELIDGIADDKVGIARQGDFYDLCRGGHVKSTSQLKHVKLIGISGSYWRGDRDGQALQRISGVAFANAKELRSYERKVEEAKKYDHRKLGKELDLFSFHQEGVGFPFFHPHGKIVLNVLKSYLQRLLVDAGYLEVETPRMLSDELWRQSGHYDHYRDNMYFCSVEDKQYALRPMNCPGALLLYKERPRSYRDLPLRLAEFGHDHRFELSGVLHGLFRVRAFTQDDGHIFCAKQDIEQEVANAIALTYKVLKRFNFAQICVALSTKPENAMGDDALWQQATESLKKGLESAGIDYEINEGDGAFYGPKIEFAIKDSMDRLWQCSTIQLDFFQPINFDLWFINNKGEKERPVMIHRAIYGSFERFFGILLEHYKGALPFWLAPVQVRILTITDEQTAYAQQIETLLKNVSIRVERDVSSDPISGKIKSAQLKKIPWMLVIGNKEVDQQTVTLRFVNGKQQFGITHEQLVTLAKEAQNA